MMILMAVTLLPSFAAVLAIYRLYPGVQRSMNEFLFKIAYFLYTNTRLGLWYHRRQIRAAKLKLAEGHSAVVIYTYGSLKIIPIPCGADNYCYAIVDTTTDDVALVDVTDDESVQQVLKSNELSPKAVLSTHKHWDHCGGNKCLKRAFPELEIYGSKIDKPHGATHLIKHKEEINVGSLKFTGLLTPGHTKGHMVFLLHGSSYGAPDCLFAGDLLFFAGAGKMFESSPETMLKSLDLISNLDDDTLIWPGHEYASDCIIFATSIDNENNNLQEKMNWVFEQRLDSLPTCPTTLREQKLINPNLRTGEIQLLKSLGVIDDNDDDGFKKESVTTIDDEIRVAALSKLRQRKDEYQKKLQSKL